MPAGVEVLIMKHLLEELEEQVVEETELDVTYLYFAFASDPTSTAPVLADSFGLNLYTGTSATHAITGLGFSPSLVWIKDRGNAEQHVLNDSSRGATRDLSSNTTAAETTRATGFLSFDSDGFTLGTDGGGLVNDSSRGPYVAWAWKANTLPSINTDGTISSTVSANQAAGFSIVTWSSTSSASDTIGHGLNSKPDVVLYKKISSTGSWFWYTDVIDGSWDELVLNSTAGKTDFPDTYATSTTFKSVTSSAGANWITYCFHSVSGLSKFGSYSGSSSDVTVTTDFQPDYVLIKRTSGTARWIVLDYARSDFESYLDPSDSLAEQTDSEIQISVTSTSFVSQSRSAATTRNCI